MRRKIALLMAVLCALCGCTAQENVEAQKQTALTVVLWDAHNPSGARSAGASTEAGIVQPGTAKEEEDLEAQTEKPAVNPILVIETRSQKDTEAGDTGEKTQEEPQNTQ